MFTVYSLVDQRYDTTRYIGITEDVYARFSQHLRCDENNIDKNEWIQDLKYNQTVLLMKTIETVDTFEQAREREDYWIHYHLQQGASLLNLQVSRSFSFDDFLSFFGKSPVEKPVTSSRLSIRDPQQSGPLTMTFEQVMEATGLSKRMLNSLVNKRVFRTSPRNNRLITIRSVNEWLEKNPKQEEVS